MQQEDGKWVKASKEEVKVHYTLVKFLIKTTLALACQGLGAGWGRLLGMGLSAPRN